MDGEIKSQAEAGEEIEEEPGRDFGILPHEYKRDPGRKFDMAVIASMSMSSIGDCLLTVRCWFSTARAKGAIGRLDFHFTPVLSARGEPECAARGLNNRAARLFVGIINKLIEPNL
jgi:hypothetical protein